VPEEGWVMSLCFETNVFASASTIVADIVIKNVSSEKRRLMRIWGYDFTFAMKDSTGKGLVELPYQTQMRNIWDSDVPLSLDFLTFDPGKLPEKVLHENERHVGQRFDLSRGGTFTIRAQRKVPKLDGSGEILLQSNEETITIAANPQTNQTSNTTDRIEILVLINGHDIEKDRHHHPSLWGVPEEGWVMSLCFGSSRFYSGSWLDADIRIKNVSERNRVLMVTDPPEVDYALAVKNSTGKEVAEAPYQEALKQLRESGSATSLTVRLPFHYYHIAVERSGPATLLPVRPGRELQFKLEDIWQRFDFSRGGTFTMRAQRKVPKLDGSGDILLQSNEETITFEADPKRIREDTRRWGATEEGWMMSLWFETNVFASASAIVADIEIKNVSRKYQKRTLGDRLNYFTMKDSTGRELVELPYQTRIRNPDLYRPRTDRGPDLEPGWGRRYETESDIGQRFDLSRGGTFTIRAERNVPKLDGSGEILLHSNEETITIGADPETIREDARRWGECKEGWVMSLRFKSNVFASASTIVADIVIRNVSRKHKERRLIVAPGCEFTFAMKDSKGKELVELPYQTKLRHPGYGSRDSVSFEPGQVVYDPGWTDIGRRFDLSRGGTFTIRAQGKVPKLGGYETGVVLLESNEETITIGAERKERK
jgi:hypothetical protein